MLGDIAAGTCSVLDHGYLTRVEQPRCLPIGRRQASHRHSGVTTYRDVEYDGHDLVVELDGRVHHGSAGERDRDMDRDLEAAVGGTETLRVSYGQVYDRPCLTAARIVEVLRRRGWTGQLVRCAHCG